MASGVELICRMMEHAGWRAQRGSAHAAGYMGGGGRIATALHAKHLVCLQRGVKVRRRVGRAGNGYGVILTIAGRGGEIRW